MYGLDFLPNWKNYLPCSLRKFRFAHLLRSKGDKTESLNMTFTCLATIMKTV
jgi:hypothetical protein